RASQSQTLYNLGESRVGDSAAGRDPDRASRATAGCDQSRRGDDPMGADATQLYAAHLAHRRSHRHTTNRHRQHHSSNRPEWPCRGHAGRADLGDLHAAGDNLPQIQEHLANGALKVEAYSQDNTMKLDEGSLDFIDNEIVQTTGSVRFRANFPNKAHRLWPGQLINAWLLLDTRQNGVTVPAPAGQAGP